MSKAEYRIFGDQISGNCLKVKWTADLLNLDYEWIEMDILSGACRDPEFLKLNPAGQVPFIVLADGKTISQSNAIVVYLLKAEDSSLLPADAYEYAQMLQWMFWEQYTHEPAIAVRRFKKHYLKLPDTEIDPILLDKGYAALKIMEDHLTGSAYFVGADLSAADISLVAYTRLAHEGGYSLADFPRVKSWISKVENTLGINES